MREYENKTVYSSSNGETVLYFNGEEPTLKHCGHIYTFGCQPYEPMAIILENGKSVAYIHNAFDVKYECINLLKGNLVRTITGRYHNAEHFCRLLTHTIDVGFDWDIGELERSMCRAIEMETGEIFYQADGVVFGRLGEEPDDTPRKAENQDNENAADAMISTPFTDITLYITVDGKTYHLLEGTKTLMLTDPNKWGKKSIIYRINQYSDGEAIAFAAAYCDEWRSGKVANLLGKNRPYTAKTFSMMLAYAVRGGKREYNMTKIEQELNLFSF